MTNRARGWCFTYNNPEVVPDYCGWGTDYVIVGNEVGEEGTPHHQGYAYWSGKKSFSAVRKLLPLAHWEVARGSAQESQTYCSKQEVLLEAGTCPAQGKRSDIQKVTELVETGHGMRDIIPVASSYQSLRTAELLLKYVEPARPTNTEVTVLWWWGATGTGKSREAFETYPDAWISGRDLRWFDGYDQHPEAIIDDFRGDFCTFHMLLRLLDRYPMRVEVKGGSRQWVPTTIVITSAYPPDRVYKTREDVGQLTRRITEVREFCPDVSAQKSRGNTNALDNFMDEELEELYACFQKEGDICL